MWHIGFETFATGVFLIVTMILWVLQSVWHLFWCTKCIIFKTLSKYFVYILLIQTTNLLTGMVWVVVLVHWFRPQTAVKIFSLLNMSQASEACVMQWLSHAPYHRCMWEMHCVLLLKADNFLPLVFVVVTTITWVYCKAFDIYFDA